ncbi:hypothetical protein DN745_12420 [Bradymonas sediminis]|uniref:Uncharacterized protein n=1 Tax=Bradymonas sediminis TaxID=1548548 RepID=A0A2Z4FN31_9DELT|nr:hypothetical protein DN745_12420 [Bradymonas sediminis]
MAYPNPPPTESTGDFFDLEQSPANRALKPPYCGRRDLNSAFRWIFTRPHLNKIARINVLSRSEHPIEFLYGDL